jgi:cobalt-zinc-cadmium efflux system membrane fusion protein
MYISGHIQTENMQVKALPEDAIVIDEGRSYFFLAENRYEDKKKVWIFRPIEVKTGISDQGWVEITLLEPLPKNAKVVWNKAYYLIAEMKKKETSHEH